VLRRVFNIVPQQGVMPGAEQNEYPLTGPVGYPHEVPENTEVPIIPAARFLIRTAVIVRLDFKGKTVQEVGALKDLQVVGMIERRETIHQ